MQDLRKVTRDKATNKTLKKIFNDKSFCQDIYSSQQDQTNIKPRVSMEMTFTQFVAVVKASFVWWFLNGFIDIGTTHQLLRPLPHGQT